VQTAIFIAEKKRKQINISHTQKGIGHSHKPVVQVEGQQRGRKWRNDKKAWGKEKNLTIIITQN
jgi:hypothetical protein